MKKIINRLVPTIILLSILVTGCGSSSQTRPTSSSTEAMIGSSDTDDKGSLRIEDGMAQPMLEFSSMWKRDYSNKNSDILRFCVYVETDYDTDGDDKADLVKAYVQLPRAAAEGKYKAGVIYDPTPYNVGTIPENYSNCEKMYIKKEFDYQKLYTKGEKRKTAGQVTTLKAASEADSESWNYQLPNTNDTGYYYGGTLPYEVATTGVKGLETIIPIAGIASWYDYTFYMQPTVYTIQKGHRLKLILMTWDPYRAFLDEDFLLNTEEPGQVSKYDYSYTIDNTKLKVSMPLADQ